MITIQSNHKHSGFTLVEVLIALVILAIALTSCLWLLSNSTKQFISLREHTIASWVADNERAQVLLDLITINTHTRHKNGSSKMLGTTWHYTIDLNKHTTKADTFSVAVYNTKQQQRAKVSGIKWLTMDNNT